MSRRLASLHRNPIDLGPRDPDEPLQCDSGWRGPRRALTLHPRQGFGVCPRCWQRGIERTPSAPLPPERWPYGPPDYHETCCSLHTGGSFCDCKASDAGDTEYGAAP